VYEPAGDGLFQRRREGINQVAELVHSLTHNPASRRHIIEGWNVSELEQMALPPCHKSYQFYVADGRLSGILYQRSCDLALGVPFNIFSAALLLKMLAVICDLEPADLVWMGADVHLYRNHAELVETQLARQPAGQPRLRIIRRPPTIFDFAIGDFAVEDYHPQPAIKAPVAV
jgi:thymidylate synthase